MKVIHNHVCSLCNDSKTCFVFNDFESLFSCCKKCCDELEQNLSFADEFEDVCSLCGRTKLIKQVTFEDSLFFSTFNLCNTCNNNLKQLIETTDEDEFNK